MIRDIDAKDPAEIIPVTFDFEKLTTAIASVINISVAVKYGTDPASAGMIIGPPVISGASVTQLFGAGVEGLTYLLRADIETADGARYALAGNLYIRPLA